MIIYKNYIYLENGDVLTTIEYEKGDIKIFRNGQLCASDSIWEEINKSYGSGTDDTQLPLGNVLDPVQDRDSVEQRRKDGRCERCGKLLEFKTLAMLCPDHGFDYKLK